MWVKKAAEEHDFEVGSFVCLPDEAQLFVPAKVDKPFNKGQSASVKVVGEKKSRELDPADTKDLKMLAAEALDDTLTNVLEIPNLDSFAMMHLLRIRLQKNEIYTLVGSTKANESAIEGAGEISTLILIAMNPFKSLPLYTDKLQQAYMNDSVKGKPHIYTISQRVYNELRREGGVPQSVVVSGQSGAGKTEATKQVLAYLASASRAAERSDTQILTDQLLQANPLLEAFGNAKTVNNDNSSRFGKVISVDITSKGTIHGGKVVSFLLEKIRVVHLESTDRNYHIFYQLQAGTKATAKHSNLADLVKVQAQTEEGSFRIAALDNEHMNSDGANFAHTVKAAAAMKISSTEQGEIWQMVSAILHVGHVTFTEGKEEEGASKGRAEIADPVVFQTGAELFGVSPEALQRVLCSHRFSSARGSVVYLSHDVEEAKNSRDSMCMRLYAHLFLHVVKLVNVALGMKEGDDEEVKPIHILDIFGFETMEVNRFEQLCINYANEKLQAYFNQCIFEIEALEYTSEGIDLGEIVDDARGSKECSAMFDRNKTGILAMLQDECRLPQGSDKGFLEKAKKKYHKHNNMHVFSDKEKLKIDNANEILAIKHYAGEVHYDVNGFLEKSQDRIRPDVVEMLTTSTRALMATLHESMSKELGLETGPAVEQAKNRRQSNEGGRNAKTLGVQFKEQLADLMAVLGTTNAHFVRCIKSNHQKKPNIFDANLIVDQLNCSGLLEVCRIRQFVGFPIRMSFEAFCVRYSLLLADTKKKKNKRASTVGGAPRHNIFKNKIKSRRRTTKSQKQRKDPVVNDLKRVENIVSAFRKRGLIKLLDHPPRLAVGVTKVFMKAKLSQDAEAERTETIEWAAKTIGKSMPMMKSVKTYNDQIDSLTKLRAALEHEHVDRLVPLMGMLESLLPHEGAHLPEMRDAKRLKKLHKKWVDAYEKARDGDAKELKARIDGKSTNSNLAGLTERGKWFLKEQQDVSGALARAKANPGRPEYLDRALKRAKAMSLRTADVAEAEELQEQLQWQARRRTSIQSTVTLSSDGVLRDSAGNTVQASETQRRGSQIIL